MKSRLGSGKKSRSPEKQDPENLHKLSEELGWALDESAKRLCPPGTPPPEAYFIDLVWPQFRTRALIVVESCALATRSHDYCCELPMVQIAVGQYDIVPRQLSESGRIGLWERNSTPN